MYPFDFFKELSKNNNREWFADHKPQYEEIRRWWLAGIEQVHAMVSEAWPEVKHSNFHTFRIYRDTRFSLDKTPFKTHIGSTLAPPTARDVHSAGVYLEAGMPTSDTGVFVGIWAPESNVLKKLRRAIVDNIEEWEEIVKHPDLLKYYPDWFGERLKTAPKGWPKDHPQIEYLRLKHLGRFSLMSPEMFASEQWMEEMAKRIIAAVPLLRFLDYSVNEDI